MPALTHGRVKNGFNQYARTVKFAQPKCNKDPNKVSMHDKNGHPVCENSQKALCCGVPLQPNNRKPGNLFRKFRTTTGPTNRKLASTVITGRSFAAKRAIARRVAVQVKIKDPLDKTKEIIRCCSLLPTVTFSGPRTAYKNPSCNKIPSKPVAPVLCINSNSDLIAAVKNWFMGGKNKADVVTKYGEMSNWCFSQNVYDMSHLFENKSGFNEDISKWNTTYITNMSNMFSNAAFNQDISNWDTSHVYHMDEMFLNATFFSQNIRKWNALNVVSANNMVKGAYAAGGGINCEWLPTHLNKFSTGCIRTQIVEIETSNDLKIAVSEWMQGPGSTQYMAVVAKYGSINDWTFSSKVKNMHELFRNYAYFNDDIGKWNTEYVTDMASMFYTASAFNKDIGDWNVGRVTNMDSMFHGAKTFNQDIGNWDTSRVTDMGAMFYGASIFNKYIGDWNTNLVQNMSDIFTNCFAFDQDINTKNVTVSGKTYSAWNTSKVINMNNMFSGCLVFNKSIQGWNTDKVADMSEMFHGASSFNQNIASWNTGSVKKMGDMFHGATAFDNLTTPLTWNTENVIDMGAMFQDAKAFKQDISLWNISKVIAEKDMVLGANGGNYKCIWLPNGLNKSETGCSVGPVLPIAIPTNAKLKTAVHDWLSDPSSPEHQQVLTKYGAIGDWTFAPAVIDMSELFKGATSFNDDISKWNTSNITDMSRMFWGATAFKQDISLWSVSKVTAEKDMVQGANGGNYKCSWLPALNKTDTGCVGEHYPIIPNNDELKAAVIKWHGSQDSKYGPIGDWTFAPAVTDMSLLFKNALLFNDDITKWDTANITEMQSMFNGAAAFNQDISSWNVPKVKTYDDMVLGANRGNYKCIWLPSRLDKTKTGCMATQTILTNAALRTAVLGWLSIPSSPEHQQVLTKYGSIGDWKFALAVADMSALFKGAATFNDDISKWNTSNITDMSEMFYGATHFNQPLKWNTDNVLDMNRMFSGASFFKQDINYKPTLGEWSNKKVANFGQMFANATAFNQSIKEWKVPSGPFSSSSVTDANHMFSIGSDDIGWKCGTYKCNNIPYSLLVNASRFTFGCTASDGCF